jgi:hypothetical protein
MQIGALVMDMRALNSAGFSRQVDAPSSPSSSPVRQESDSVSLTTGDSVSLGSAVNEGSDELSAPRIMGLTRKERKGLIKAFKTLMSMAGNATAGGMMPGAEGAAFAVAARLQQTAWACV